MLDDSASRDQKHDLTPKWESANLDVLRSVAVLLVVIFHFLEFFRIVSRGDPVDQLGHWGVLLFFVHTSLVLMLSLERQRVVEYRWPNLVFFIRRIFRIFPLSVAVVAAVCVFRWPVGDTVLGRFVPASFDLKTVASNLFLVQNLTHSESVMATLWTLPYEMQMYLVLPLLFQLASRRRGLLPLLFIWIVAGLLAKAYEGRPVDKLLVFAPCFISGVVGYWLLRKKRSPGWPFWGWLLVLTVTTLVFLRRGTVKSGWICCLIVGVMVSQFRELKPGYTQRACQLVARYSYGIYLSHYICIWFAFQKLSRVSLVERWSVFALSAIIAPVIMYHALEAPMIEFGSRLVRGWRKPEPARARSF
jgi:peptidoglycan/LPS O-acetylase OafA/YrhL